MSKPNPKGITVFCPTCDTRIRLEDRPQLYDIISCPECEEEYEVIGLSPLKLEWIPGGDFDEEEWADEEDWDDDSWEYEDEDEDEVYDDSADEYGGESDDGPW